MIEDTKLDKKDSRILAELDKDARQTDSEIAKNVKISKQVANYRIQNLIKNKIIENFYTIIDVGKLGLNSYYVFLQFENINKEKEKLLLNKLTSLDFVGWLVSGTGRWDAIALIYANSTSTFAGFLNKIMSLCGNHLHEYEFTTLLEAEHLSYKFLLEKEKIKDVKQTEKTTPIQLKLVDKKILSIVSQNARKPIVDIASRIKQPAHIAKYHLKNLKKSGIIEGFKPKININKFGYQWYLLLLQFQITNEERKREFLQFCKQHKRIYYLTNTIGKYNLMLDIHVRTIEEFKGVLLELKEKFSDIIKFYESLTIFEEYKIDYFPRNLIE